MYVILRGKVDVSLNVGLVKSASNGAIIGKMALIDIVKAKPAIGMAMMRSMAARLCNMNTLLNA
jgi:CRP-like cAMP-binding protein